MLKFIGLNSIKTKTLALLILALIALIITNLVAVTTFKQSQTKQLRNNLKESAVANSKLLDEEIKRSISDITLMTGLPIINGEDKKGAISFLKTQVVGQGSTFGSMALAELDGTSVDTDGIESRVADLDYFKAVTGGQDIAISEPLISNDKSKMTVNIAVPVKRDGQLRRVLYGRLYLDKLSEQVIAMKNGEKGRAYLITAKGICIAHPDKNLLLTDLTKEGGTITAQVAEMLRKIVANRAGEIEYIYQGVDSILNYQPIPTTGWIIAIVANRDEVFASLNDLTRKLFLMIAVTTLMILALGFYLTNRIVQPLIDLAGAANRVAQGDLNSKVTAISQDETGRLAQSFEIMRINLKELIGNIALVSTQVSDNAKGLASASEQISVAATESASTVGEISAAIDNVVENIKEVSIHVEKASQQAGLGQKNIDSVINTMQEIEHSVNQVSGSVGSLNHAIGEIGQFLEIINGIAEQTNLLALNAAIEAARAGESGRGFAIVADEVRKLAESSAQSAKEINRIIAEVQRQSAQAANDMESGREKVSQGDRVVHEVSQSLVAIIRLVQDLNRKAHDVATAAAQVDGAVQNVASAIEEQTATIQEVSASTVELSNVAGGMDSMMSKFRV